jgi:hypothetical protein
MPTEVKSWKANDGSLHASFEAAQKHEFFCFFKKFNRDYECGDPYTYFSDEAIEILWLNKHNVFIQFSNLISSKRLDNA